MENLRNPIVNSGSPSGQDLAPEHFAQYNFGARINEPPELV